MIHRFRFLLFLPLFAVLASHAALAGGEDQAQIRGDVVAAAEAWELIGNGALLVDVRSAEEFAAGSIENAVNVPHTEIDELAKLIGADKHRSVVFFCRSGRRSGRALEALEDMGYTGIFNGTGYTALKATRP